MDIEELEKLTSEAYQIKNYDKLRDLLIDKDLVELKSAKLYFYSAGLAYMAGDLDGAYNLANLSISLNPFSSLGYYIRGLIHLKKNNLESALKEFDQAIVLEPKFSRVYFQRALIKDKLKNYKEAIEDYSVAISLNSKYSGAYKNRATDYAILKLYSNALKDLSKAITLPDSALDKVYNVRGAVYNDLKEYKKALKDYNRAISINPKLYIAYRNKAIALLNLGKPKDAIVELNSAIKLNANYSLAYYTRGNAYDQIGQYKKAIFDFEKFVELQINIDDYNLQVTKVRIKELKVKLENVWYEEIDNLVTQIKDLLKFTSPCITHFTSLSSAKAMVLDESLFRLSEGNFLNDTSEGRELFNYLDFSLIQKIGNDTLAELFVIRPFIGSFVSDSKHDDLALWRMYGKEAQVEAKGCAITFYREDFIKNLVNKLDDEGLTKSLLAKEKNFTFYQVAYRSKDTFVVPGNSARKNGNLNKLMKQLTGKLKMFDEKQKISVVKLLNDIAYLFKSSEYQYENEIRLVVQGVGFKKNILTTITPPRVYIELISVIPVIHKITLGPKVERADEWAAAFNYKIEEVLENPDQKVKIIMSHLPFK